MINTAWFDSFMTAVECKSLSQAAERLSLTQQALGKQIRNLEQAYGGILLLQRSSAGVIPTEAGELLYRRLRSITGELQSLAQDLQPYRQPPPALRIGALPTLAAHYLPQQSDGQTSASAAGIHLLVTTMAELAQALAEGRLDAALLEQNGVPEGFWSRPLFSEPYLAIVPEHHPLADADSLTLEQLAQEPLIVLPTAYRYHQALMAAFDRLGIKPRIAAEVRSGEFLMRSAAAGAGVTVVPRIAAVESKEQLGIRALPITDFGINRTIVIAARNAKLGLRIARQHLS